jgi:MSHA biogenesis protein MshN
VLPSLAEPSQARLVVSAAGVGQATAKATPTPKAQALSLPIQALPVGPPTPAEPNTTPVRAVALAASRPASVPAVALNAPLKPTRQAAMEALAQAQALWNDGAHSGALELLKVAIIRLEALPPVESATMAALVRDYVRMALAQGQALEAVGLLERLEPQLSGVADVWALRGNAAQRLGRHQEAVNAYLTALLQRPDEARWMLGAAVSLAALGQTAQAGDLAEKARATGALKPDVAAYLRQLGVVVRQD